MSARFGRSFVTTWGVLVLVMGCAKGQMGGEIDRTTDNVGEGALGGCEDGESTLLAPDDEIPESTFKLQDLISAIEGQHEATMAWLPPSESHFDNLEVSPPAGATTLHVSVTPLAETGRLIDRTAKDNEAGDEATLQDGSYGECPDRVAVDARVVIRTDNGALDQEFTATFWTTDGVVAQADIQAEPPEWGGSFEVDASEVGENASAILTGMDLAFAFGALSGTLGGAIEDRRENAVGMGGITYARFPAEAACETGFELPNDAPLHDAVQQLLDEHTQFDFAWQGEEAQDLTIETSLGTICYNDQNLGYSPGFTGQVQSSVRLADASIDGNWSLEAFITQDENGALARVEVQRQAYMVSSYEPAEFAEQTGIHGVTSEADALSFSFGFAVDTQNQTASGELTLLELTMAACQEEVPDEPAPDEGMGSPGCRGTDAEEIKNAQFVESSP